MNFGRFARTVARLKPSQVAWRLRYGAERAIMTGTELAHRYAWRGSATPAVASDFPYVPLTRSPGLSESGTAEMALGIFRHLHEQHNLGYAFPDWRLGERRSERLWTVSLHYHAWLFSLARIAAEPGPDRELATELFLKYASDWINQCGLETRGTRPLVWSPYAVATRLTNWIRIHRYIAQDRIVGAWGIADEFLLSIWQHAAYLSGHMEWDLLANHVMRNAAGLAWAGRFFAENESHKWLQRATDIAESQLQEQVLPDGAHFERSPMYHVLVMEDLLAIYLLVRDAAARNAIREAWIKMAEYLQWVCHPDGQICLFNDAALNGACQPQAMLDAGRDAGMDVPRRPQGLRHFADAGTVVWHGDPWSVLFDAGPVGASYQPGHAHADSLTVECSLKGRRFFVDPGTFHYDAGLVRDYDRSTAAHNTVEIDSENSSEVWDVFRVGRRAQIEEARASSDSVSMQAVASHNGYSCLSGSPRHERTVEVTKDGMLRIRDHIAGRGKHVLEGGFLLSPEWKSMGASEGWELSCDGLHARVYMRSSSPIRLVEHVRPYHPEFGLEHQTKRLCWTVEVSLPCEIETVVMPQSP